MSNPIARKLAKDFGLACGARFLTGAVSFLLLFVLTKHLQTYYYGIWSLGISAISVLAPFFVLGAAQSLERFLPKEKIIKEIQEYYYSLLFLMFFIGLALIFLIFTYSDSLAQVLFQRSDFSNLIKIIALVTFFTAVLSFNLKYFRSRGKIVQMYSFEMVNVLLEFGFITLIMVLEGGVLKALCAVLLIRAGIFIVTVSVIISQIGIRVPRFLYIKPCMKYAGPTILYGLVFWFVESGDRYFIQYFMDPQHVGIYSAAYGVGSLLTFLGMPLMVILPPVIFKFWDEKEYDKVIKIFRYSLKYFMIVSLPILFAVGVLARELLLLASRQEFVAEGAPVVLCIAIAKLLYGITGITSLIFLIRKKSEHVLGIWILAAVCNVIANIILIPRFGILGAAYAALISYFVPACISTIIFFRATKSSPGWGVIGKSLLASSVMAASLVMLNPVTVVNLLIAVLIGIVVYASVLLATRTIQSSELLYLRKVVFRY